jgi:hypothetical protein
VIKPFLIVAVSFVLPVCGSAQCPVTTAPNPLFVPSTPYSGANPLPSGFWYGTESLWTWVFDPTRWRSTVAAGAPYDAKLVYWRAGFDAGIEHNPDLTVVARRLDFPAPLVWTEHASGIKMSDDPSPGGMAMMTGMTLPTAGCWEIAARYCPTPHEYPHKYQTLSIIVWLNPNSVR